jgi:hypothetical protein
MTKEFPFVHLILQDKISILRYSKNPRRILEGFFSISYPYDFGNRNFIIPYSEVAIGRIYWAEESQFENTPIGDYEVMVFDGLRRGDGVYSNGYV